MPPLRQRSIESSPGSIPPVRPLLLLGQSMESASVQSQRSSTRPIPLATLGQSSPGLSSAASSSHEGIDFSGGGHNEEESDEETRLLTQAAREDDDDEDDDDDDLHSQVLLAPTEPPSRTDTETHDPDIEIEEPHVDAARVIRDILLEEPSFDKYQVAMNTYLKAKKQMIDARLPVVVGKGSAKTTWLVVDDIKEVDVPVSVNYFKHTGIKGFDFSEKTVKGHDGKTNRINFLHLLQHLWPGDWWEQLAYLNSIIQEKENSDVSPTKKVLKRISEHEFWRFFGLLLAARLEGRTGTLWDTDRNRETTGILKKVDYTPYMNRGRFTEIRQYMKFVFADKSLSGTDDWWQIMAGINGFNENRRRVVQAPNIKVLDETMSAWRPQTRKSGNLPSLSFILRKPEPLGTEFKDMAAGEEFGMFENDYEFHTRIQRMEHIIKHIPRMPEEEGTQLTL